ncbi:ATP-dependent Clp protease proteolytic subunit [Hyphococcus sp.]|uniref:ATP-dependent Clp protease proteolytic subunit n=1 Tax=Hyphococcus sp. TaxID=2038636 RepID=UPI00208D113F|nr:MAG: hypothetical protein DHS20C04_28790 [Marinicaulis sp.]
MTPQLKNRLMLVATLAMLGAAAFIMARNEELIFRDKGELTVTRDANDPDTLVFIWRDKVEAPMARRFEEAWREWGNKGNRVIIDLHSPGGDIAEGAEVIRVIERMKRTHIVDTRVRSRRACYSMCVPIYLHGEERYAAANARFMFHEPSAYDFYTGERVKQPKFERDMLTKRYFNIYFVNSPITPAWRDQLAQDWKGRDLFFTARQLVEQNSNIVTVLE